MSTNNTNGKGNGVNLSKLAIAFYASKAGKAKTTVKAGDFTVTREGAPLTDSVDSVRDHLDAPGTKVTHRTGDKDTVSVSVTKENVEAAARLFIVESLLYGTAIAERRKAERERNAQEEAERLERVKAEEAARKAEDERKAREEEAARVLAEKAEREAQEEATRKPRKGNSSK